MALKDKKLFHTDSFKTTSNVLNSALKLRRKIELSKHACLHISEVSAVMVGAAQAGVGLTHLSNVIRKVDGYIDDLLAIDSLIFTIACITAFWAFRSPSLRKTLQLEQVAESFFVIGLLVMVIVSLLTAYSSIKK